VAELRTGATVGHPRKAGPSPVRAEIQRTHEHLQGQTADALGNFDAKAEIVKTPDGTLKSRKSLFVQTEKQVAGDAEVTLDAAKDAVQSVLKHDK
jgi:conjugal transfer mating pair stabilization protein TraG